MATLRQAIERVRNDGQLPPTGPVGVRDLINRFQPSPRSSLRSLQLKMFERGATKLPWAVILCRFKGEPANPAREAPVEQFYRRAFTPGTGGLVEYWRDVSLGKVDISASRVFGWIEVDLPRDRADGRSGATRSTLVDAAIAAVKRDGKDPITGFHSQLSVYTENWSIDGVPPGLDWSDPEWGKFWIDGSADGRGKVSLTPPHNANIAAHEMGHGFGMEHDLGPDLVAHYGDPCCIMSQQNSFVKPTWDVNFGPAVCLPHLVLKGWMYPRRLHVEKGGWVNQPGGVVVPLAALNDPGGRANLGIKLVFSWITKRWDYYLEYVTPTDWNRGLGKAFVIVRRVAPFGSRQSSAFLGAIEVPTDMGTVAQWLEPAGNVSFTVERFVPDGRVLKVGAIRH
jgi:hypothetical protein